MPKGTKIKLEYTSIDLDGGYSCLRLTPLTTTCHRNYFYQKCFTKDGDRLLFSGEFDGVLNYYLLDIKEKTALQLTEGAGDNSFGGFLSADDRFLYYVKNGASLYRLDLSSLQEEEVYRTPKGWVSYGTWTANSSETQIVGVEIHEDYYSSLPTWESFVEMYRSNPLCRLFTADLSTGKQNIILEDRCWYGHPLFRPFDDRTIAFCHEGPHDLVDARIWFISPEGKNMRKFKDHAQGESCTHEFWIPNGSLMMYVSFQEEQSGRVLYTVNSDTLENKLVMPIPNCSHLMSNWDGSLVVGDGAAAPVDVVHRDRHEIKTDENLYIMNTHKQLIANAGPHKTSWKVYKNSRQITHPHPSFSPDEKQIIYTSDFEGETAVYLIDIKNQGGSQWLR